MKCLSSLKFHADGGQSPNSVSHSNSLSGIKNDFCKFYFGNGLWGSQLSKKKSFLF